LPIDENAAAPYPDVAFAGTYHKYIAAVDKYLPPRASGLYEPDAYATREEIIAATIDALRLTPKNLTATDILDVFSDKDDIYKKNQTQVAIAVERGFIKGMGDGTIMPKANVRRAEVAVIFKRILDSAIIPLPQPPSADSDFYIEVTSPLTAYIEKVSVVGNVYAPDTDGLYVLVNGVKAATRKIDGGVMFSINITNLSSGTTPLEIIAIDKYKNLVTYNCVLTYISSPQIIVKSVERIGVHQVKVSFVVSDARHYIKSVKLDDAALNVKTKELTQEFSETVALPSGRDYITIYA
jgi:hypothetical protein